MGEYKGDETTGFQSPAQDYIEGVVDLAAILDLRRPGRYTVRVKGHALAGRGIRDGDILVADAAAEPKAGKVCVAMVAGATAGTSPRCSRIAAAGSMAAAARRPAWMLANIGASGSAVTKRPAA